MWVFCCGMQRSGSTLQFQIAAHLVEMANKGERQEWVGPEELVSLLQKYQNESRVKVIKTHVYTDHIEHEFRQPTTKGVYCYRDIRDVVVSFMHKENKGFNETWVKRRVENNLQWYENWNKLPNMLVSRYEDMTQNLAREVQRIAQHLDISIVPEQAEEIAALYTIEKQREVISKAVQESRLEDAPGGVKFDPHTLLHTNHIHSGAIGGWKSILTAEQAAFVEQLAGKWLVEHGY